MGILDEDTKVGFLVVISEGVLIIIVLMILLCICRRDKIRHRLEELLRTAKEEKETAEEQTRRAEAGKQDELTRHDRDTQEFERKLQEAGQRVEELEAEKQDALTRHDRATRESQELERQLQEARQRIEKLEAEKQDALTRHDRVALESRELEQQLQKAKQRIEKLEAEKHDALTRLSEAVSHQVTDNNPNIVDLSDVYRPVKLAELSNNIYDYQWLDAYDALKGDGVADEESERILLDLLMICYSFCSKLAKEHMDLVTEWFIPASDNPSRMEIKAKLKEGRKQKALEKLPDVEQECISQLKHKVKLYEKMTDLSQVQIYLRACVKLCWLMMMQDPPVVMVCPGWKATLLGDSASVIHQVDLTSGTAPSIDEGPCEITNGSSTTRNDACGHQHIEIVATDDVRININEENPNEQPFPISVREDRAILDRPLFNENIGDEGSCGITNGSSATQKVVVDHQYSSTVSSGDEKPRGITNESSETQNVVGEYRYLNTPGTASTGDGEKCAITNESPETQNVIGGHHQHETGPNDEIGINVNKDRVILDKHLFKEYTQHGKYIKYIVWPCMLLHEGGQTLNKGVAQGYD